MRDGMNDEVIEIVNDIVRVIRGRDTAAVYTAISLVIGQGAAAAKRPNLDQVMEIIEKVARAEFEFHTRGQARCVS